MQRLKAAIGLLVIVASTDQVCGQNRVIQAPGGNPFFRAAFSPDGKILATTGLEQPVRLWDVAKGTEIASLKSSEGDFEEIHFSADGKILGATLRRTRAPRFWNVDMRKELKPAIEITTFVFSPDGKSVAAYESGQLGLYDLSTWKLTAKLSDYEDKTLRKREGNSLKFSPDGKSLVCAGDTWVRMLDLANKREKPFDITRPGIRTMVRHLEINPDGKTLAIYNSQHLELEIRDFATGKVKRSLENIGVNHMTYGQAGYLYWLNDDRLYWWQTSSGEKGGGAPVGRRPRSLSFSGDRTTLAVVGDEIHLIDRKAPK